MKKYKKYMDGVKVSDTLHQRLTRLDAPKARPAAWKRYGAVAAALVLAVGVGAWGLGRTGVFGPAAEHGGPEIEPENDIVGVPDIAIEDPNENETLEPGQKTMGGYEVTYGGMTSYCLLPWIDYGMSDTRSEMAMDWDLPAGSTRRDLTQADIAALFGQEENLSLHLDWKDYDLTGWAGWLEDGSLWGVFLNGYKGEMDHFEFAFTTDGSIPPACIAYLDGVENNLWDTTVTAYGFDSEHGCDRRVTFVKDGLGYRFDLTATDTDQAGILVSRLVRWVLTEGLNPENLTQDGAEPVYKPEDSEFHVGEPNWNDSGETPEYDPMG